MLIGLFFGMSTIVIAADQFTAIRATFPIIVNGNVFTSDKAIVTINGSTYLPLRALGEALGVKVNWNSTLNRVEIGEAPIQSTSYSFSNPAPLNVTQTISIEDYLYDYTVEMTIKDIIRGDQAWSMIKSANQFNDEPPSGYEYMLVKINIKVPYIADGKSFNFYSSTAVKSVSSSGKELDYASVVNPSPEANATLYMGASNEGWAVFLVGIDDSTPKLVFGKKYDGSGGIWFQAYK